MGQVAIRQDIFVILTSFLATPPNKPSFGPRPRWPMTIRSTAFCWAYSRIVEADLSGKPPHEGNPVFLQAMGRIVDAILAEKGE